MPVSQTPVRVIIAEDEALIRLDLKEMLEEEGYEVAGEAADGQKAVELASTLKPDLVILDVKMPILDGISAAEQIAAQQIAPVVILTAFSQRELVDRARDAGAMAYLVKPFTKADLVPAIDRGPVTDRATSSGWSARAASGGTTARARAVGTAALEPRPREGRTPGAGGGARQAGRA